MANIAQSIPLSIIKFNDITGVFTVQSSTLTKSNNIQEWQDSSGTVLSKVESGGALNIAPTSSPNGYSIYASGAGGAGGGGAGGQPPATSSVGADGNPGSANTGGGAGGSWSRGENRNGGNGGSGIVILRYPNSRNLSVGAGLTTGVLNQAVGGTDKYTTITGGTGTVSWS